MAYIRYYHLAFIAVICSKKYHYKSHFYEVLIRANVCRFFIIIIYIYICLQPFFPFVARVVQVIILNTPGLYFKSFLELITVTYIFRLVTIPNILNYYKRLSQMVKENNHFVNIIE